MRALGHQHDPTTGAKETIVSQRKGANQKVNGFTEEDVVISNNRFPNRLATPAHPWAADTHPYVGRWVVPTTQRPLSELPHRKRCEQFPVSFLWGASFAKMRALGHQHDPTTGAKETIVFHRGKPNRQWVHRGRRGPWVINNNRHPWAADTHPYVGRWVVPTTQRPLSELPHRKRCEQFPVPYGLVLAQLAAIGFSPLLVRAREIDWLSNEGTKIRALGRADDPTTSAKETPGFTDQVWANQTVNEFTEEDVGLGSSATTGSPIVWPLLHIRGPQTRTHTSVVGSSSRPNARSQNCHTEKAASNSQFLMD